MTFFHYRLIKILSVLNVNLDMIKTDSS